MAEVIPFNGHYRHDHREPHGCFDAHLHIIDPRFALIDNQGYRPEPFTVENYRKATRGLDIRGGAIVSGSFQGADQNYLLAALDTLGGDFVGVTQLPDEVSDERLLELDEAGVRAIRFNLRRGVETDIDAMARQAQRVFNVVGWHCEIYADASDLTPHLALLRTLPSIVIDHLGLSQEGLPTLLALVEAGARVKATGFGRVSLDVPATLAAIADINPHALLFGTDLPGTRAPRPFSEGDIELLHNTLGDTHAMLALHDNAVALYRPRGSNSVA
ncbi:amidohydrolase family protein [Kushneria indalinina]|uniref:Putative TIM-barrel fold metal-dependent hydrolase n=1 Tax=Kushneria indalinina DSM 14324 TaxID=1122140 RepID=A0A3D9DUZ4_9GAMM|nr:amidohydrolase family protein [Kushneria indalinina]REC94567.1 putative TIM-barrel fold metal-dependent hydrolase [Kushneria indalinina DSM 14324]